MSSVDEEKSLYGSLTKVEYCTRCVVSNQRPRITFDEEGVCSACRYAERKRLRINWKEREQRLLELLDRHRSTDGKYDIIVPVSGGKDSAYVAHQLKHVYGMHPLTVTVPPLIYTDIGWQNFKNFIDSGFDNLMFSPNGKIYRRLCRLGFEHLGDPFEPFVYGVKAFPLQVAVNCRIPLIFYGENGEVEYGGDKKNEDSPTHDVYHDLHKHYFKGAGAERWVEYGLAREDLKPFVPPSIEQMQELGVQCHFFGYYKKWTPQENFYYSSEHTGFQPNPDGRSEGTYSKYASLDDKVDGLHYFMMFIKFGIGRATSDAAHEIRDGHLTREEAVALVQRFDGEFPSRYFKELLEFLELTEGEFQSIVDSYRLPHLWKRINGLWKLRYQVS